MADYLYLKKKIQNFENRNLINKNKQYYNKYIGETVHILANGPSLTTEVLESLSGEKVIVMNNFFMGDLDVNLEIVVAILLDPKVVGVLTKDLA